MNDYARQLRSLLERERLAVTQADIETLMGLQAMKREALDALAERGSQIGADTMNELAEFARANIGLMRHLVHCLRGIITGGAESTYTQYGAPTAADPTLHRATI